MIFVSTSCFFEKKSVIHILKEYAKQGIRNIELGASHNYEKGIMEFLKEYKKKYNAEFTIHGYFPPEKKSLIVNLASQNSEIVKRSIAKIKKMIDIAKQLDVKLCSFHAGFLVDPEQLGKPLDKSKRFDYEKGYATFLYSANEICRYASLKGVKIAFEPNVVSSYNVVDGKNEPLLMCRIDEIKIFYRDLEMSGIKNLGLLLDLGHLKVTANNLKFNALEFIETFKNNVLEIHIHENEGLLDEHKPLKEDSWALKVVNQNAFKNLIITLEVDNLSLSGIQAQSELLSKTLNKRIKGN